MLAALLLSVTMSRAAPPANQPFTTWSAYGGSGEGTQYSALKQIDKTNVGKLKLAWFHPIPGPTGRFGFNPLIVDGAMYVLGNNAILALDAATGKQLWAHPTGDAPTDRGINYWESKDRKDRRLIFGVSSYLTEIDARTGLTIPSFGDGGRIDLRVGLNRDPQTIRAIMTGTPGRVFENLIVLGSATSEAYGAPPGDVRAYNVMTGKIAWTFHTVPHPGEFGYKTWPQGAWKYIGGVNAWGEMTLDSKRGLLFIPLGAPTMDFYGGDRAGMGLFGDCLLVLNAKTGKRLWHFQIVHHDLWDYDAAAAPQLITVRHNGKPLDIVAMPTKSGFLYVFDRVTGKPLWPIEERPVPKSEVPGEQAWPTQPFPTKPPAFAKQKFPPNDINPYLDDADKARILKILENADNRGVFTPPSLTRDVIVIPPDDGGANWGAGAADPATGMMYVRSADGPEAKRMTSQDAAHRLSSALRDLAARTFHGATQEQLGHLLFIQNCQGCHGPDRTGVGNPKLSGVLRFKKVVANGNGEMPSFSYLPEESLNALVAYLSNPSAGNLPPGIGSDEANWGRSNGQDSLGGGGNDGDRLPYPPGQLRFFQSYGGRIQGPGGLPASAPPWTTLTAYDLNEGTLKWQIPLGTVPFLAAKGITNTGQIKVYTISNRNAPVVTAGGLIFIGSWADRVVHAFDKQTGKELWQREIDGNPEGLPAVYQWNGRQYVVFCAAGKANAGGDGAGKTWKPGKPEGQGYYVFAL